ncbi:MAG: hypothetical protein IPJ41_10540 [Phycisphaerales bacterium]|nr:hypothetical protein [Phycisphaerales bacterium]
MSTLGGVSQSALSLQHVQPGRIPTRRMDRDGDGDQDGSGPESVFADAAVAAGVDRAKVPGLLDQIKQAVDASNGGAPPDPATLSNTVHSVLEANGVNITKFDAAIAAQQDAAGQNAATTQAAQLTPEQQSMLTLLEQSVTGKGFIVDTQA